MVVFRRTVVILVTGTLSYAGATVAQTGPGSGDPPGRVGRLAFVQGAVSFHDDQQTDWAPALVNSPVTSGDAIWTQPNARSEVSIAGTRVRLDSATQLDMLALDDSQTRMQLDQGRIDIKTFTYDTKQPYEIVTPRGKISLQQQGDYYVEAGTTQDPTRLGVRQGAAQITTPNGQVLAVRAGEVGEVSGDGSAPQLHTVQAAPPPMPAYWADRDRQVVYDQPTQYLGAGVTGYEDLNAYGSWSNDPEYGQVWAARSVPAGWSPYSTGRWNYEQTYGWTWVDEQPWGFAPYHYGRWAQRNNRWFWVPPERQQRAVYAPALVAFVGGTELGLAIGQQNRAPVGWFPLGPREAYVPSYSTNRDYYRRVNAGARVQQQVMDDRWQRAQRHDAVTANNQPNTQPMALMNRRFATVVPAEDFARSRPVERVALKVAPDKIATAPVAFVAAPPSPTASIRTQAQAPNQAPNNGPNAGPRPNEPNARPNGPANVANFQAIKPEPERQKAPGPQVVTHTAVTPGSEPNKPNLPQLAPRHDGAPAPVQIQGERRPGPTAPGQPNQPAQANAPAATPLALPPRPGEPIRPEQRPGQPPQPNTAQPQQHPGEAPKPPQANIIPPPRPGEPPRPPQANITPPPRPGEPPRPPQIQAAPQPPQPAETPKPPQVQAAPQPPHPAEAPKPQQAEPPKPQPQAQPPQRQGMASPPPPHQMPAPAAAPQVHTPAPPPQQAHVPAPPPPQVHAPAPPPQQVHAPAPPPPQVHAPAPPPQPQRQAAPPPPPPTPHPAPPPPQQAQAPHPAPAPAPAAPPPPKPPAQPNNNEKK